MAAPLRPVLAELKAYEPEEALGDAPLDANENPWAPPAAWRRAAAAAAAAVPFQRYPNPQATALRRRLAAFHGLPPEALLFGNGSDELIALLFTAFGGGDPLCLLPTPTFSMYRLAALAQGWRVHEEPLDAQWGLTGAFVDLALRLRPRLIILADPNNPTGNALDPEKVDALRRIEGVTLVHDEAYGEFGGRPLLKAAPTEPGLVVLKTFSKAWGLAGLRLGYLVADPALVRELDKVRQPYNVDAMTQALAAAAVDLAPEFLGRVPGLLALRARLEEALKGLEGAEVWPSDSNFVLVRHPRAEALHAHLLKAGLRVRRFGGGRLEKCLRINAGDEPQTRRLEAALKQFTPLGSAA